MNAQIVALAQKKFTRLSRKYDNFINVIADDWRGYRFVFDTKDVRNCDNDCQNCPLYQLLKYEAAGVFSATLYPATHNDQLLFGPQNYLNCKTLEQYRNCYINFLVNETKTKREFLAELILIKNLKIIYSKDKNPEVLEQDFKKTIFRAALKSVDKARQRVIQTFLIF